MRASGRALPSGFGIHPRLLYLSVQLALVSCTDYGIPIEIKLWDTGRTPLAHMVDVTNGFGLKVLAEHNFLNDNNIAFSPYGLMGILVALYEGVDGESSFQIQRGMQLPWNRNVMRIGFRDIHRTLKTYFVPEEGFLAGLALNNENVTFNESYKKILRFYGFDLENDQLPTFPTGTNDTINGTATNETTTTAVAADDATTPATMAAATTTVATSTESSPNREELSTTPMREETTLNPNAETIGDVDLREPTSTTMSSGVSNVESTTGGSEKPSTTEQSPIITEQPTITSQTVTTEQSATTSMPTTTTQQATTTEQAAPTAQDTTADTTQFSTATQITSTEQTTATEPVATTLGQALTTGPVTTVEQATNTDTTVLTTTSVAESSPSPVATTLEILSTSATTETTTTETSSTVPLTDEPTANNEIDTMTTREVTIMSESTVNDASTTTSGNTQTSVTAGITETQTEQQSTTVTDSSSTPTETDATTDSALETLERRKRSVVDFIFTNPPYVDDYLVYKSYDIGAELPPIDFDDQNKMFLVNGLRRVQVTYMRYDTILEHAYLPHLEASALRLPLDSDRYYLLVILPARGGVIELGRLLARMARESDLSDVYAALRPRRVHALVPSFTVKGHVTLTTDLQKLGIRDVFEPRQHDFTPMTHQAGVYVRSIEQAVSVAIRKYRPDEQNKNRYVNNRHPVKFRATYPFLYFVMDASIHVALMAGKMVDPLNTRIL